MGELDNLTTHIFLTGNAGTGKTTLIKKFIESNSGEVIVLAPTGIAAVNCGGMTIHKFFHFPARPINYASIKKLDPVVDYNKIQIIKRAKYIIIDEISMVRADIMDQIGWFFHKNFPDKVLGGKIFIMVGDLDQLPPVVATEDEREMILARYKSEFFFDAKMWQEYAKFETIKLEKVWRQKDPYFVGLLNKIKNNAIEENELEELNSRCINYGQLNPTDGVMLCSTNKIANLVNKDMVDKLPGGFIELKGEVVGDFNINNSPVDQIIDIKLGARVMTLRNDPEGNYFNGTIGTLESLNEESGALKIKTDEGKIIFIGKYIFESVEYSYDKNEDKIRHRITGQFIQYPIRLAYALTIHKSQGQTFDKVIIDLGDRGAFAHGQVYVALSRCRTLEGVTIRRKIQMKDLIYNSKIADFNASTIPTKE